MQRTISAMVGKGSVNHNSRKFRAENVDGTRTHLNIDYCNENIKTVYHELFDEALERYNAKQTRVDRKIKDYYEKIRSSKQKKPFHEIILQVVGKGNMNADTENGELAKQILDEYYQDFRSEIHSFEYSPHICIWMKQHRICTLILFPLPQAASVDLIQEFRSNRHWQHKVSKAVLVAIRSGRNGYKPKRNSLRR